MVDTVVYVVGAVVALEAGGAGAGVGGVVVHAGRPVLTRVKAPTAELHLLLAVLACHEKFGPVS